MRYFKRILKKDICNLLSVINGSKQTTIKPIIKYLTNRLILNLMI